MNESTAAGADEEVRVAMTILGGRKADRAAAGRSKHQSGGDRVHRERRLHNLTPMLALPMHDLPPRWAIWRDGAADGVTNMATDAALLATVQTEQLVWRWYAWAIPTISFGRHEATAGRFHADQVRAAGLDAVRRPTGGRALLHAREITYSVTCPLRAAIGWRVAYDAINRVLLATLQAVGVPAALSGPAPAMAPDGPICFEAPAEGEIVVAGRKLVGSAVWRQGHGYLQHGSILLHDDQPCLAEAAVRPLPPAPPAAALAQIAPAVTAECLADALERVLGRAEHPAGPVTCQPFAPSADVHRAIASQRGHFADPSWLWRR
jgi:lipoate-protein ligase A